MHTGTLLITNLKFWLHSFLTGEGGVAKREWSLIGTFTLSFNSSNILRPLNRCYVQAVICKFSASLIELTGAATSMTYMAKSAQRSYQHVTYIQISAFRHNVSLSPPRQGSRRAATPVRACAHNHWPTGGVLNTRWSLRGSLVFASAAAGWLHSSQPGPLRQAVRTLNQWMEQTGRMLCKPVVSYSPEAEPAGSASFSPWQQLAPPILFVFWGHIWFLQS